MTIVVVTHFPSPYQVELFNEINRQRPGILRVLYLFRRVSDRRWTGPPISHDYAFLDDKEAAFAATADVATAEVAVFNYYNDARAAELIRVRAATDRPWCFWGERPGYRFPRLARLARFGRLAALRNGSQPIWGIGQWAVEEYRKQFGASRPYVNLPYFSCLGRFQQQLPAFSVDPFTFLFSGALISRKGVDVLARAFVRLAKENARVRLKVMGDGEQAPRLRRMLASTDRVEWVGFKDWADLPAVYASAQALCVPSRHDGWGLVVPEGLASGLPTIATNRTGAALDLLRAGQNGWLIDAGDDGALFDAMQQAAALSAVEWTRMRDCARASVAGHTLGAGASRFLEGVAAALNPASGAR